MHNKLSKYFFFLFATSFAAQPNWYLATETGYAWSSMNNQRNLQTGAPFLTLAFGKHCARWLEIDLSYTYFQTFHVQISEVPSQPLRFFDVTPQTLLFNLSLDLKDLLPLSLGELLLIPTLSTGCGSAVSRILYEEEQFYSFTFAWQTSYGLRMRPKKAHFSFDVGYRYQGLGPLTIKTANIDGKHSLNTHAVYLSYNAEW